MTIDEAIKHTEEVAKKQENNAKNYPRPNKSVKGSGRRYNAYLKCAEEHRQLAEWLKDYKRLLEQEPCEDCVSRDAVEDAIANEIVNGESLGYAVAYDILSDLPSITPQPKMGRWIAQEIHNCHTDFKCSECGYIHSFMHLYGEPTADYTYCPNCGVKMQEVEE